MIGIRASIGGSDLPKGGDLKVQKDIWAKNRPKRPIFGAEGAENFWNMRKFEEFKIFLYKIEIFAKKFQKCLQFRTFKFLKSETTKNTNSWYKSDYITINSKPIVRRTASVNETCIKLKKNDHKRQSNIGQSNLKSDQRSFTHYQLQAGILPSFKSLLNLYLWMRVKNNFLVRECGRSLLWNYSKF